MNYRRDSRIASVIVGMFSVLILMVLAFIFLSSQQKKLNQEFNQLIYSSLTSYTDVQKDQILKMAGDAKNLGISLEFMMEAAGLSPEDQWMNHYLAELERDNPDYNLDYVSSSNWKETISGEGKKEIYKQVLDEKMVILDIQDSPEDESGYIFSVAQPLQKNGTVKGVLFSAYQMKKLGEEAGGHTPFKNIHSFIIEPDGSIVYSSNNHNNGTGNLFTTDTKNGIVNQYGDVIKTRIEKEDSFTTLLSRYRKKYYISVMKVGVNDWSLVNYVCSPDIMLRSEYVFGMFFGTALLLIVLTIAGCFWIFLLFYIQKKKLKLESERYSVLSQFTDTLLYEYDYETDTIEFTSNARRKLFLEQLKTRGIVRLNRGVYLMHPEDWQNGDRLRWALLGSKPDEVRYCKIRLKGQSGEYRWFSCQYKILPDIANRKPRMVGKLEDITVQLGREEMLLNRANKDPLTGVYNRSGEEIIDGKLSLLCSGVFFMIDLDNFKEINDTCGHAVGDQVLTRVARAFDKLVGSDGIVARVGGDEFVIFIADSWENQLIVDMAQSIMKLMDSTMEEDYIVMRVSASIGIAVAPKDGSSYAELYSAADKAMYYIKQNDKKGFAFYRGEGKDQI
ncbi:diguanylate cyclase [Clostridium boliviensis]|uniref:Diguanylate cyclase n=1 Tax=Clostridium boliviensis TaxID=318465 RepID=A0ABU4GLJ7_9CLOT|nr:diguanylate cyclase [Clostridium boliviensis]MDW2797127.1 diguanylate cyclase [Clostridium boliviensis]